MEGPESPMYLETIKNGFGKIDPSSHISQDSFANPATRISNHSQVIASSIQDSKVCQSTVSHSTIQASNLNSSTVVNSSILASHVRHSCAVECRIERSTLQSVVIASLRGEKPCAEGVDLRSCTIEGNVKLVGPWSIDGPARMHEGEWYRPPRFRVITSENGIFAVLTECISGRALIACNCQDMRRWLRSGPRLGRFLGWPAGLVREAAITFEEWLDTPL